MTAAVWGTVDVQALQQRFKYIDVIIMVSKMLTVHGVDKVFTVRTVIVPGGVKGQDFFGDRDFADTIFCFAVNYVEVSFRQVDIFFFQVKQFGNTDPIVDEHKNRLVIAVIGMFP